VNEIALFPNQKFSILQLAIFRAFCELYLKQLEIDSELMENETIFNNKLQFPLREISKCLIQYYWPFFEAGFIALSEKDSIQNTKIKFRKQLTELIQSYSGDWEESYFHFTKDLNLSLKKRLINQKKDLQIKSCLQAIEQAILKGPVSLSNKISESNHFEFKPKENLLILKNEIQKSILKDTQVTLLKLQRIWLELILKWNADSIYSESDFRKMIYFDSFNKDISI
jgi:hypothetical protein